MLCLKRYDGRWSWLGAKTQQQHACMHASSHMHIVFESNHCFVEIIDPHWNIIKQIITKAQRIVRVK